MTVYGFHSLRHSFASFCAEAGVPKAVLLSILGTDSDIADKYYTHVGEDAQQLAINAISLNSSRSTLAERVQRVIALIDSEPEVTHELLVQIKNILQ
jgi:site-specific recombinase XerD